MLLVVICCYQLLFVVIRCHLFLSVVICCYLLLFVVIRCYLLLSVVICCYLDNDKNPLYLSLSSLLLLVVVELRPIPFLFLIDGWITWRGVMACVQCGADLCVCGRVRTSSCQSCGPGECVLIPFIPAPVGVVSPYRKSAITPRRRKTALNYTPVGVVGH